MSERDKKKLSIPRVLRAINEAEDEATLSKNHNTFICACMAPLLVLSAAAMFSIGHFALHIDPTLINIGSAAFLMFGFIYFMLARSSLGIKATTHVLSAISSLFFCFSVVCFYDYLGPSLWLFGFVLLSMSVLQSTRIMLTYVSITMLIFTIYTTLFKSTYSLNEIYLAFQFAFFVCLVLVLSFHSKINASMIKRLMRQLQELKKQIEERKKVEAINERMALYDQLTGLPNRVLLYDRLEQALKTAKQFNLETYVLFIDIDYFKTINDSMGHSAGDELLKQISGRLGDSFRKNDTLARMGGDEFLLIMQDVHNEQVVLKRINQIRQQIGKPFYIDHQKVYVTCSIGVSRFPDDSEEAEMLIKGADIAMYKAKEDGKNGVAFYSDKLKKSHQKEMRMIIDLKGALSRGEFELFYQPQLNGVTKQVIGFEALLRWNHPAMGLLLPMQFIPLAEKTGHMNSIGEWVLRTACLQNKAWQDAGIAVVPMAVNLSVNQICSNALVEQVAAILEETGMDPKYLELEITERTVIKEMKRIKEELERLKKIGVRIAVDDFGTGFSSIQYLRELPIDLIKIPINFVHGIDNNEKDESIISVILSLAASMQLDVIAEGVETKNQLDFLLNRMCNNIQGFYFSRPMQAEKVTEFCRQEKSCAS